MSVKITQGDGTASVATEVISNLNYQQIKVVDGTASGTTGLKVNGDGSFNASIVGIPSVSGTLNIGDIKQSVFGASIIGTVPITVTNANQSIAGAVQIAGNSPASILTLTRLDNQVIGSMIGTVGQVTIHGATALGSGIFTDVRADAGIGALLTSVVGLQGASVSGTVNIGTQSGSVVAFQGGTQITSIVSIVPSSVIVGASIFGQLPAGTAVLGSVATLQGTNPWIITGSIQGATVANQSVSGTVGASIIGTVPIVQSGTIITSISGTANTAITSIATLGGFIPTTPPIGATVQGIADLQVVQGASVTAIAAQGTSVFTYITGVQVTNFGSSSVLVRLGGGLGSTLGWTIAPAGGGSNIVYPTGLKTGANSAFTASINGVASVLVSAQGFTSSI